jgi:hypothetical protein
MSYSTNIPDEYRKYQVNTEVEVTYVVQSPLLMAFAPGASGITGTLQLPVVVPVDSHADYQILVDKLDLPGGDRHILLLPHETHGHTIKGLYKYNGPVDGFHTFELGSYSVDMLNVYASLLYNDGEKNYIYIRHQNTPLAVDPNFWQSLYDVFQINVDSLKEIPVTEATIPVDKVFRVTTFGNQFTISAGSYTVLAPTAEEGAAEENRLWTEFYEFSTDETVARTILFLDSGLHNGYYTRAAGTTAFLQQNTIDLVDKSMKHTHVKEGAEVEDFYILRQILGQSNYSDFELLAGVEDFENAYTSIDILYFAQPAIKLDYVATTAMYSGDFLDSLVIPHLEIALTETTTAAQKAQQTFFGYVKTVSQVDDVFFFEDASTAKSLYLYKGRDGNDNLIFEVKAEPISGYQQLEYLGDVYYLRTHDLDTGTYTKLFKTVIVQIDQVVETVQAYSEANLATYYEIVELCDNIDPSEMHKVGTLQDFSEIFDRVSVLKAQKLSMDSMSSLGLYDSQEDLEEYISRNDEFVTTLNEMSVSLSAVGTFDDGPQLRRIKKFLTVASAVGDAIKNFKLQITYTTQLSVPNTSILANQAVNSVKNTLIDMGRAVDRFCGVDSGLKGELANEAAYDLDPVTRGEIADAVTMLDNLKDSLSASVVDINGVLSEGNTVTDLIVKANDFSQAIYNLRRVKAAIDNGLSTDLDALSLDADHPLYGYAPPAGAYITELPDENSVIKTKQVVANLNSMQDAIDFFTQLVTPLYNDYIAKETLFVADKSIQVNQEQYFDAEKRYLHNNTELMSRLLTIREFLSRELYLGINGEVSGLPAPIFDQAVIDRRNARTAMDAGETAWSESAAGPTRVTAFATFQALTIQFEKAVELESRVFELRKIHGIKSFATWTNLAVLTGNSLGQEHREFTAMAEMIQYMTIEPPVAVEGVTGVSAETISISKAARIGDVTVSYKSIIPSYLLPAPTPTAAPAPTYVPPIV